MSWVQGLYTIRHEWRWVMQEVCSRMLKTDQKKKLEETYRAQKPKEVELDVETRLTIVVCDHVFWKVNTPWTFSHPPSYPDIERSCRICKLEEKTSFEFRYALDKGEDEPESDNRFQVPQLFTSLKKFDSHRFPGTSSIRLYMCNFQTRNFFIKYKCVSTKFWVILKLGNSDLLGALNKKNSFVFTDEWLVFYVYVISTLEYV